MALVADFIRAVGSSRHAQHDSTLATAFRGHANCTWELMPSLFRASDTRGIGNVDALERWMRFATPVVQQWPQNAVEWLALAQHNGIPTGLLDWTLNPLVALFFASEQTPDGDNGCVWSLDTAECEQFTHTLMVSPFSDRTAPAFLPILGANARARAQFGVMTLHGQTSANAREALPGKALTRFDVAAGDKHLIRRALGVLGVTDRTVFPDLTVAAAQFMSRHIG
ncbi:MAG: FRG domain-containing protein [Hyphomonadaceae bacterium]